MSKKRTMPKYLLRRYIFYYVSVILILLAAMFLVFVNLPKATQNVRRKYEQNDEKKKEIVLRTLQLLDGGEGQELGAQNRQTCILGREGEPLCDLAAQQLRNMKEPHFVAGSAKDLTVLQRRQAKVVLVAKEQLQIEEISALEELVAEGKHVVFLRMPGRELLVQQQVRDFLGIREYRGEREYAGYRTAKELMLGAVREQEEIQFTASEVTLGRRIKVFCSALLEKEDIKNEELPPLIWRYIPNGEGGSVYVLNGDFYTAPLGYGVIASLYCDMQQTYLYPIVNAYCFFVEGMPYTENFESEVLRAWYSRDARGVQRDLLFPQLRRCGDRYGVEITWYTRQYDAVQSSNQDDIAYLRTEIGATGGELGSSLEGRLYAGTLLRSVAEPWKPGFGFRSQQKSEVNLPILLSDVLQNDDQRMNLNGMVRGTGFLSVSLQIDSFLYQQDRSRPEWNWASYCMDLETVLGVHQQDYGFLDRVTASEAAERVAEFLVMQPAYRYEKDGVRVTIENFGSAAYFILKTNRMVAEVENGGAEAIGEHLYLIRADAQSIFIRYQQ